MASKKRKERGAEEPQKQQQPAPSTSSSASSGGSSWWGWLLGRVSTNSSSTASPSATTTLPLGTLPPTYVEGWHDEEAVRKMPYRKLGSTGMVVSVLSLGASSLGGVFGDQVDKDEAVDLVVRALKSGVNVIDTAPWYGQGKSERVLSKALRLVPREAFYLNTKVGRYELDEMRMFDFRAPRVTQSVYESLERLGVSYVDTIQVHDPEFAPDLGIVLHETLPALHALKQEGIVRHAVGVTGYPISILRRLLEESPVPIDTCLSYCHHTLNNATLVPELLPLVQAKGVGLINASPLSMGLLTPSGPPAWHPALDEQKRACRQAVAYCEAQGVDVVKLALWFSLFSEERVPTTLVSTASSSIMMDNVKVAHAGPAQLSAKERKVLDHVRHQIFRSLGGKEHWEGVEVGAYWSAIGKRVVLREVYGRDEWTTVASAAGPVVVTTKAGADQRKHKRQRV